jgi:hypothetical protein
MSDNGSRTKRERKTFPMEDRERERKRKRKREREREKESVCVCVCLPPVVQKGKKGRILPKIEESAMEFSKPNRFCFQARVARGCQMVCISYTKDPNLGIFGRALEWKIY